MRAHLQTPEFLSLVLAVWLASTANLVALDTLTQDFASQADGSWLLVVAPWLAVVALSWFVLLLFSVGFVTRVMLSILIVASAGISYAVSTQGVVLDPGMLSNIVETNPAEAGEYLSPGMLWHLAVFGLVPATLVFVYPLRAVHWRTAAARRIVAILAAVLLFGVAFGAVSKELTAAARNHREVRYQLTPFNLVMGAYVLVDDALEVTPEFRQLATDAHRVHAIATHKPVVRVVVVGETARADHFGLNGYARETTPRLDALPVTYFSGVKSCGTSTRISLPCMFSVQTDEDFDPDVSRYQDNLLDIAQRAGYRVIWVDNGNSCKHVCERVETLNPDPLADAADCVAAGCYDAVLVTELRRLLATLNEDALIVLHQLGSHGPAYYQRYPDEFRRFTPDCRSADLADCTPDEIRNAYDNTIAYTDAVVADLIDTLDEQSDRFDVSLLYVSDHGESLGEKGLFLHGMPNFLAPEEQTHVPMFFWSRANKATAGIEPKVDPRNISHDYVFHTLLHMLDIDTDIYQPDLDLFVRPPPPPNC